MTEFKSELLETVNLLCTKEKGILAADESTGTIGKRFSQINLENNLENRIAYRKLLFTTPNLNKNISGVITFEEPLKNKELIDNLKKQNIVVGIKVDKGVKPLYNQQEETVTQGLDNLDLRCQEYYKLGARFAKWRSVLKINKNTGCPTDFAMFQNVEVLARYASICQQNGLVPIVEPEILMDGNHTIMEANRITVSVLTLLYQRLNKHNVILEASLLKPNMVRDGVDLTNTNTTIRDIGLYTDNAIKRAVPSVVPGIFFLSGGMSEQESTAVLNEINKFNLNHKNWHISFSYGRALQYSVLKIWQGKEENIVKAQ